MVNRLVADLANRCGAIKNLYVWLAHPLLKGIDDYPIPLDIDSWDAGNVGLCSECEILTRLKRKTNLSTFTCRDPSKQLIVISSRSSPVEQ